MMILRGFDHDILECDLCPWSDIPSVDGVPLRWRVLGFPD